MTSISPQYVLAAYGGVGLMAYGDTAGGYFSDPDDTGRASVASGDIGIAAEGSQAAGWFDGSVGIGTFTPSVPLEVVGNAKVTGDLDTIGTVSASSFTGDGSGLSGIIASDADTLDGMHASDFIDKSATAQTKAGSLAVEGTLQVDTLVRLTSGATGLEFPDGTTQTTACTAYAFGAVHTTGQEGCWGGNGEPILCSGTGQDGEYQKGVLVAPRFTDNGDGTVTDNLTGLIWLQNANCFGVEKWANALSEANNLETGYCGLTDGSMSGQWRLPNIKELLSLFDYGEAYPALPVGHPFAGVQSSGYWSSTTQVVYRDYAWGADLGHGDVDYNHKIYDGYVWPVRGGQ